MADKNPVNFRQGEKLRCADCGTVPTFNSRWSGYDCECGLLNITDEYLLLEMGPKPPLKNNDSKLGNAIRELLGHGDQNV